MFYTYILYSEKLDRYYIGSTDDAEKRLREHNEKKYKDAFTSRGIPWKICQSFAFEDSKIAYAFEKFIKKMKSRKFIEKLIHQPKMVESILVKLNK